LGDICLLSSTLGVVFVADDSGQDNEFLSHFPLIGDDSDDEVALRPQENK